MTLDPKLEKAPRGLGRRKKEQKLFVKGIYSNDGKATVYLADAMVMFKGRRGNR